MGRKLSGAAAAKFIGWHKDTVYRAVRRGRLRAEQTPGGQLRIDVDDLKKIAKVDPPK